MEKKLGLRYTVRMNKKVLSAVIAAALVAFLAGMAAANFGSRSAKGAATNQKSLADLYMSAVHDAVFAEPDEIQPLVCVASDSDLVTFNQTKDKVLMLNFNNYPESYVAGQPFVCKYGAVWTFTDKEIIKWYKERADKDKVADWPMHFNQLLGMPCNKSYKCVTALWARPADLRRPAYQTDITKQIEPDKLSTKDVSEDIREWFKDNIVWSYFDSAYPWTRLGYTYDWADNGKEYGLSEFLILKDSVVDVEWTKSQEEFLEWLKASTND